MNSNVGMAVSIRPGRRVITGCVCVYIKIYTIVLMMKHGQKTAEPHHITYTNVHNLCYVATIRTQVARITHISVFNCRTHVPMRAGVLQNGHAQNMYSSVR